MKKYCQLITISAMLTVFAHGVSAELSYKEARKLVKTYENKVSSDTKITLSLVQEISAQMQERAPYHAFLEFDQFARSTKPSKQEVEEMKSGGVNIRLNNRGWIKSIQSCRSMDYIMGDLPNAANEYGMRQFNPDQLFSFIIDFTIAQQNSNAPSSFKYTRSGQQMCVKASY
mgnify:FL=1